MNTSKQRWNTTSKMLHKQLTAFILHLCYDENFTSSVQNSHGNQSIDPVKITSLCWIQHCLVIGLKMGLIPILRLFQAEPFEDFPGQWVELRSKRWWAKAGPGLDSCCYWKGKAGHDGASTGGKVLGKQSCGSACWRERELMGHPHTDFSLSSQGLTRALPQAR